MAKRKTTALAPWYGCNRELAEQAGQEMGRRAWVGVSFMGGAPELPYFDCRAGVANDLHRAVINLARVVGDKTLLPLLAHALSVTLFHEDVLREAQAVCVAFEKRPPVSQEGRIEWAFAYFVAVWMGRSGMAGQKGELKGKLSVRWTSSGGDSAVRFRSAVESLVGWNEVLRERWSFVVMDAVEFVGKVKDKVEHGVYVDAPWVVEGAAYRHEFDRHEELATALRRLQRARVVVRYGDHPRIRALYPSQQGWRWLLQETVNQEGAKVREALITRGGL